MIKKISKYIYILLFIFVSFLQGIKSIGAVTISVDASSYPVSSSGACIVGISCFPILSAGFTEGMQLLGIRMTIVDQYGNQVQGTTTRDFLTNHAFSKGCVDRGNDITDNDMCYKMTVNGYLPDDRFMLKYQFSGWENKLPAGILIPRGTGMDITVDGVNKWVMNMPIFSTYTANYGYSNIDWVAQATLINIMSPNNYDIPVYKTSSGGGSAANDKLKQYLSNTANYDRIANMAKEAGYGCLAGQDTGNCSSVDTDYIIVEPTTLVILGNGIGVSNYYYGTLRELMRAVDIASSAGGTISEAGSVLSGSVYATGSYSFIRPATSTTYTDLARVSREAIGMAIINARDINTSTLTCDDELDVIEDQYYNNLIDLNTYVSKLRSLYDRIRAGGVSCSSGNCSNVVLGKNTEAELRDALSAGGMPSCSAHVTVIPGSSSSNLKCRTGLQDKIIELTNERFEIDGWSIYCNVNMGIEIDTPATSVKQGNILPWSIMRSSKFGEVEVVFNCNIDAPSVRFRNVGSFNDLMDDIEDEYELESFQNFVIDNSPTFEVSSGLTMLDSSQDLIVDATSIDAETIYFQNSGCSQYQNQQNNTRYECSGDFDIKVSYDIVYDSKWMFNKFNLGVAKLEKNITGSRNNWIGTDYYGLPISIVKRGGNYSAIFDYSITLGSETVDEKVSCNYEVKTNQTCPPSICPPGTGEPENNLVFRVIDTSNPFPGLSGLGRDVGTNWCSDNLVDEYGIIHRGSGCGYNNSLVLDSIEGRNNSYNTENEEPMYSFILNSESINQIRDYNEDNAYDDYKLTCSNGEKCVSEFLNGLVNGSLGIDVDTDGTCMENRGARNWFNACAGG